MLTSSIIKIIGQNSTWKFHIEELLVWYDRYSKKNSDENKWMYSGYGIVFDGLGSWNFGNDFTMNFIVFGVYNSSSSHTDNRKNDFLVLGEGPTDYI